LRIYCGHGVSPEKRDGRFSGGDNGGDGQETGADAEGSGGGYRGTVWAQAEPAAGEEVKKKNGYRPLQVGFLPAKADNAKQKAFVGEKLKPLIKPAKEGIIELFFVDASHFVMGGFGGMRWSRVRCFVKTACGRKR
jgi:hypothetical protein